jgi:hypothetical protein
MMICPKCGSQQEGLKCRQCGLIFLSTSAQLPAATVRNKAIALKADHRPRFLRICLWAGLIVIIVILIIIGQILIPPPLPSIVVTPEAPKEAAIKVQNFNNAISRGIPGQLQMNESQLNGWLASNIGTNQSQMAKSSPPDISESTQDDIDRLDEVKIDEAQYSYRDVKGKLENDFIRLFATINLHGRNILIELDGRPLVKNGYFTMDITGGKLGHLPIPSFTLQELATRIFNSPQLKERFKLRDEIQEIRIRNGQLYITSK